MGPRRIILSASERPPEKWSYFDHNDLWFSAEDAVRFGIADEIAEFDPPVGTTLFTL